MKTSILRSIYIIFISVSFTALILLTSMLLALVGKLNRAKTHSLILLWARGTLRIPRIRRSVVYHSPLPTFSRRTVMIMCNHASLYDIPITFDALPELNIRMLAKRELARIPLFGAALKLNEFIFVDRHNRNRAMKDLESAKQCMESGIALWVAPEGTRSMTGRLLPFKKGVFHLAMDTEAIIIPIGIRDAAKVLPPKTLNFSLDQAVEVHIGRPIDCMNYTKENKELLIQDIRHQMEHLLNLNDKGQVI